MLAINTNQIAPNNGAQDLAVIKAIDVERKDKVEKVQPQDGGDKVNISQQGKDLAQAEAADQAAKTEATEEAAVDGKKSSKKVKVEKVKVKKVKVKDTAAVEGKDNAVAADKTEEDAKRLESALNELTNHVSKVKSLGVSEKDVEKAFTEAAAGFEAKFGSKIGQAFEDFGQGKISSSEFFNTLSEISADQAEEVTSVLEGVYNELKTQSIQIADTSDSITKLQPTAETTKEDIVKGPPLIVNDADKDQVIGRFTTPSATPDSMNTLNDKAFAAPQQGLSLETDGGAKIFDPSGERITQGIKTGNQNSIATGLLKKPEIQNKTIGNTQPGPPEQKVEDKAEKVEQKVEDKGEKFAQKVEDKGEKFAQKVEDKAEKTFIKVVDKFDDVEKHLGGLYAKESNSDKDKTIGKGIFKRLEDLNQKFWELQKSFMSHMDSHKSDDKGRMWTSLSRLSSYSLDRSKGGNGFMAPSQGFGLRAGSSNKIVIGGPAIGGPMNSAGGFAIHMSDRSGETKMIQSMIGNGRSNLFSPGPAVSPTAAVSAYKMGGQNPFGSV